MAYTTGRDQLMTVLKTVTALAGETLNVDINNQYSKCQITAFGTSGAVTLEAQVELNAPFEPVLAQPGDITAISLDLAAVSTIKIIDYSLKTLRFTPDAAASDYTIILKQWS